MVRRGSTVRVRQRALKRPANGLFCCLSGVRTSLERPSTCPQDLSPTSQAHGSFGLSKGVGLHEAPPWSGGRTDCAPRRRAPCPTHTEAGASPPRAPAYSQL